MATKIETEIGPLTVLEEVEEIIERMDLSDTGFVSLTQFPHKSPNEAQPIIIRSGAIVTMREAKIDSKLEDARAPAAFSDR